MILHKAAFLRHVLFIEQLHIERAVHVIVEIFHFIYTPSLKYPSSVSPLYLMSAIFHAPFCLTIR